MATRSQNASQTQTSEVLPDLIYDMVTILHSKGEGLQAYDKYMQDAQAVDSTECVDLLRRLKEQDESAVREVQQHLSQILQSGPMRGDSRSSESRRGAGSYGESPSESVQ